MTLDLNLSGDERRLIEAALAQFQLRGEWPTFDQLDKHADRKLAIANAQELLLKLPDELTVGLRHVTHIPTDQAIKLTIRAIASCDNGSELVAAFVRSVAEAARLEEERLEEEPSATLTPEQVLDALPAAGRNELLTQLGRVLEVERWGWDSAATDYPWSFRIGREVRKFRGLSSVEDYLQRSSREIVAAAADVPTAERSTVARGPRAAFAMTDPPILDSSDHQHALIWPKSIVLDELERLLVRAARQPDRRASLAPHIERVLRNAFDGDSVAQAFSVRLISGYDVEAYLADESLEWMRRLLEELGDWPDVADPPLFYSQRHRPTAREPYARDEAFRRLVLTVNQLNDAGLFAERLGLWCPDDDGQAEQADEVFRSLLGRRISESVWPLDADRVHEWTEDDLYDVLEVLHEVASWPGAWHLHDFGGCPGHPASFSRPLGQALCRWRVNEVLDDTQLGVRIAEAGEDIGHIVKVVGESTSVVIETALAEPVPGDAELVAHAIATFRGRQRTSESLRNAIVDLAGVLERHRKLLKKELLRKDEAALFDIANNFDLRHRDAAQRGDYSLDYSEWLFQWYLATVTLVGKLLRHDAVTDPE